MGCATSSDDDEPWTAGHDHVIDGPLSFTATPRHPSATTPRMKPGSRPSSRAGLFRLIPIAGEAGAAYTPPASTGCVVGVGSKTLQQELSHGSLRLLASASMSKSLPGGSSPIQFAASPVPSSSALNPLALP